MTKTLNFDPETNRRQFWGIVFLFGTLVALINVGIIFTDRMAAGDDIPIIYPLINEFNGVYTSLLLLPFIFWMIRKFPLTRKTWLTRLPLHLLGTIVFGFFHTTLMYISRTVIYQLAGLGDYSQFYGVLKYRYLMEYQKQFVVYWLVYGVVFWITSLRENQRQKLRAAQLEEQLTKSRLQALQMQLNPHFLFNTLNMISSTMYEDVKAADKMIAYLSDLLRLTLKSSHSETHKLSRELDLLEIYVEIMRARFKDRLVVKTTVSDDVRDAQVPRFILQPLVENSIKYGMENLKTAEISIMARRKNQRLTLIIRDNGPGINGHLAQLKNNGVGLSNTAERLEKMYGNDQQFELLNLPGGGLQVKIEIPFRQMEVEETADE